MSISPVDPLSPSDALPTLARRRASPPPRPARNAKSASAPAPSKSSRRTAPGSLRMAATSWADPGLVFPNTKGKIRRRDSVVRSLRRFLEEAALPVKVRFHVLRHSEGTLAFAAGRPAPHGLQDARSCRPGDDDAPSLRACSREHARGRPALGRPTRSNCTGST